MGGTETMADEAPLIAAKDRIRGGVESQKPFRNWGALLSYGIALISVGLATALTGALPARETHVVFGFYYLALIVTALRGNLASAALAVVLSVASANFFFVAPYYSLSFIREEASAFVVFSLVATAIVLVIHSRRRAETALRTQEEARRESDEKFAKAFRSSPAGIVISRVKDGKLVEVNEAFAAMTGYSVAEMLQHTPKELGILDPEERWNRIGQIDKEGRARELGIPIRHRNGEVRETLCAAEVIILKGEPHYLATLHDISARKRTELDLASNESRLRAIIDNEPECVKLLAADGSLLEMNPAGLRMLEADSFEQVRNACVYDLVTEEHRAGFRALTEKVFAGGTGTLEFQVTGLKGGKLWLETTATPLRDSSNRIVAALGITRDITEQRAIEEALRESEARLRLALEAAGMGTFDWDMVANKIVWSRGHEILFGFAPGEFGGTYEEFEKRVAPDDLPGLNANIARCLATREPVLNEFRVLWPDGSIHWVHGRGEFAFDEEGKPLRLRGVAMDITDRKRAENKLLESQRQLRSLAVHLQSAREEEAARIARELHDEMGATLTGLKIDIAWLKTHAVGRSSSQNSKALNERIERIQEMIRSTMQRVRTICLALRPDVLDHLGLAPAIEWQATEFQRRYGIDCKVARPESVNVAAEAATAVFRIFQEVLTNVARHARATEVRVNLSQRNGEVVLEVADNGAGVSKETLASTKRLGIVGMRERALNAGGRIVIESKAGQGTTVIVTVPRDE